VKNDSIINGEFDLDFGAFLGDNDEEENINDESSKQI